jgi:hypothetical protein
LDVCEFWIFSVSLREHVSTRTPVDAESWVVPENAVFVGRSIVIAALVEKLNCFRKSQEAVSKSGWDIDLILLLGAEADTGPLAKMRRTYADIDGDIQSFAFDDTAELRLRVLQLIMKAAKRPAGGDGVIVLEEGVCDAEICKSGTVIGFEKRAAPVSMNYWPQLVDAGQRGFDSLHLQRILRMLVLSRQL